MEAEADILQAAQARIDEVADLIDGSRIGPPVPAPARAHAREQARVLLESLSPRSRRAGTADTIGAPVLLRLAEPAIVAGAAELLAAVAVDLAAHPEATSALLARLNDETHLTPLLLGRELLRSGRLLELGVEVAIEVQLALIAALTDAHGLSLWLRDDGDGELRRGGLVGAEASGAADAARRAFEDETVADGELIVRRIDTLRPPPAALVADRVGLGAEETEMLLAAAAPVLAALLDRRLLLERESAREAVTGAVQRRLARLRFDLHDGPQQDVHLLAQDLRLFRDQLRPMVATDPDRDRVMGRLDDLEAQLVALDGDLRRLSTSVQSPFLASGTLREALTDITVAFAQRTGIEPETRFAGDLPSLTESQQIAVLALVREALSNVRKHSDAGRVSITVTADPGGVSVEVSDDGSGFDTETTLVRAARTGHLGLVGMHERVRMLGGRTRIVSRAGGPTVISAFLPPFTTPPA